MGGGLEVAGQVGEVEPAQGTGHLAAHLPPPSPERSFWSSSQFAWGFLHPEYLGVLSTPGHPTADGRGQVFLKEAASERLSSLLVVPASLGRAADAGLLLPCEPL